MKQDAPGQDTTLSVTIDALAFGGAGVARHDGKVMFVPGALPGETVTVRIESDRASYAQARLLQVTAAAPARIAPACPLALRPEADVEAGAARCPGCAYQHLRHDAELHWKSVQLREMFARMAGTTVSDDVWRPPVGSPSPLGYRNKLVLHTARTEDGLPVFGYFGTDNQTVMDIPACPLVHPQIDARLRELRKDSGFRRRLQPGKSWTFRHTERDGVVCWPGRALRNDSWLREATPFGEMAVPRGSFFQINPAVGAELAQAVAAELRELAPPRLIDLYCGCGLFSVAAAAAGVGEIRGVDNDRAAIAAGVLNARDLGMKGIRLAAADAEHALPEMLATGSDWALLVDPPRTGLSPQVRKTIAAKAPSPLIYVSCGPDTLARDIRELATHGYALHHLQLFDMFPRTAHFETLAVLIKS